MSFWKLLELSLSSVLEILIVCLAGAFAEYCNLLTAETRTIFNKIVHAVFLPCIMFSNLVVNATLQAFISWWFLPLNLLFTYVLGGLLGWVLVKIARPEPYLSGIVIAVCSAGNYANVLLIIIPAVCVLDGSPFGNGDACSSIGHTYVSLSMLCGGFYTWTFTYHLMRNSARMLSEERDSYLVNCLLHTEYDSQTAAIQDAENNIVFEKRIASSDAMLLGLLHQIVDPATVSAIAGIVVGASSSLRSMVVGDEAPLKFVADSIKLLGHATVPCITIILGGNLRGGRRASRIRAPLMLGIVCVRFVILPATGMWIVTGAAKLGYLASDPLFCYVILMQYSLPPAMAIGNMSQMLNAGEDECSAIFLWMYLIGVFAITIWSAIFMSILPILST